MTTMWPMRSSAGTQVTVMLEVAGQPALVSPSDTVRVRVTGPAVVQVNVISGAVESPNVPDVAVHRNDSGAGPSESLPLPVICSGLPTKARSVAATMASTKGQRLSPPSPDGPPVC